MFAGNFTLHVKDILGESFLEGDEVSLSATFIN